MREIQSISSYFIIALMTVILLNPDYKVGFDGKAPSKVNKIGFAMLAYSEESINGVLELLDKIYNREHCYVMHFDKKTPLESIKKFKRLYPQILETKKQYDISWGQFSLVHAQIELARVDCEFDHLVYLDGATFPLRPLNQIENAIRAIPLNHSIVFSNDSGYGSNIPTCKQDSPTIQACSRSEATCMDDECTKYTMTPQNGPIYKGPQWSILSKPFINYFLKEEKWLNEWIQFFENSYIISDEAFFQSLHMNSPFRSNNFLFSQDWMRTVWLDCKTEHTEMSIIGWSPCLLGLDDYVPHLKDSTSLFARKIRAGSNLKSKIFEIYGNP
eukprot:NODE_348_length_10403_cov_0.608210.p3 type:complete len:329 gc:universal NODE_348_length_10403_cov_0.608210:6505-5519(-)